ncbi:MAG: hypothetical protein U9O56_08750 [Campylobacterota bacterium]|nr:hypothetical protein [Campylobacterota bacterium]
MNININYIVKFIIPFLIILLITYSLNTILYMFLPITSKIELEKNDYRFEYTKYQINNSFKKADKIVKKEQKKQKVIKKDYQLISNILLKAIYSTSSNGGWIIISEKSSSTTHILSIDDSFKKYKLKSIYKDYVIFTKNSKEYKLSLLDEKSNKKYTKTTTQKKVSTQNIEKNENNYNLNRDLLNSYIKTPAKIWREISIKEVFKDGKIDGFKVNKLSKNSVFKELGLKKGDIIKSVNNIRLNSYGDAFKFYKKINKIENLNLVVSRGSEELELEYEIK